MAKNNELKGNKGEWSETYVFLKLLADGKLDAADANLDIIPGVYFPIVKILRQEISGNKDFVINGNIDIYDGKTGNKITTIAVNDFIKNSKILFENLELAKGKSFSFPEIEAFLKSIEVNSIAALKHNKSDIRVVVHDLNTGQKPTLGFSIKSLLGKNATLFNPGAGTNFIYKLTNLPATFDINNFNKSTLAQSVTKPKKSKIAIRLNLLQSIGCNISFDKIQSENLELNLELIDSQLPEILAYIILHKFKTGVSQLTELITVLNQANPLNFNLSKGHPFYDVKIKSFLTESALGMTPETVWTGVYDATGGIILVKKTGDLACYHIYNKNEFQQYVITHTKLEQASTSEDENNPGFPLVKIPGSESNIKPYKYGWVYQEGLDFFIKLNLQVRFT
jgi:hypothetical protein